MTLRWNAHVEDSCLGRCKNGSNDAGTWTLFTEAVTIPNNPKAPPWLKTNVEPFVHTRLAFMIAITSAAVGKSTVTAIATPLRPSASSWGSRAAVSPAVALSPDG